MYISLWENSRGHPDNVSFMQFSMKIDGFEQKDSQGFENSYNSYEQYPLEKFFIFTIYQNYTLALTVAFLVNCFNPSTHRVHKTWTFLIITHNSWYRSRKIKEDSSTEREKFPLRFEPIFITVQCTSRSQDFSNEKWSRNLQIGNAFNDWNSTISHANWQCLTKKSYNFYIFFIVMHYTSFGSAIKRN